MASLKRIGLVVNPIAGMGGKVALKGTDGQAILQKARMRGARPESSKKAERTLRYLIPYRSGIMIYTSAGEMGAALCDRLSLPHQIVYTPAQELTTADDTVRAAQAIWEAGVDLLLFAGGDGTARNIFESVGEHVSVLGIPAGVKIQSAVFALTPESAGTICATIVRGIPMTSSAREVVDLDEDAYRNGRVSSSLYGMLQVPNEPKQLQSMKQSGFTKESDQMRAIATYLDDHMLPDIYYAVGSGSSAKCISQRLGLPYELLGVDIICNRELVVRDATEEQLWEFAQKGDLYVIVSPIGGQGFLFGRGNHQFSARILSTVGKDHIIVISPEAKILSIKDHTMHVDCGNEAVNRSLRGYYNVLCGYGYSLSLPCR